MVAEVAHSAAVVAGEADGGDAHFFGLIEGAEDVGGVAGGGDAEEDVAGLSEGFDLALEEVVEAVVVAGGGEDGRVGGKGDGAEGGTVDGEADDELGYEMLGVGGGASVSGDEELVAGVHGCGGEFADGDDGVGDVLVGEDGLEGGDGLGELSLDELLHVISGLVLTDARVRDGWGVCRRGLLMTFEVAGVELLRKRWLAWRLYHCRCQFHSGFEIAVDWRRSAGIFVRVGCGGGGRGVDGRAATASAAGVDDYFG